MLRIGGRFLCLEFSTVDVPGLDALYDFYSFNVIPALGRAVADDAEAYRYLVESIRRFPPPEAFADMMRAAGFARVSFRAHDRRHRRAAFGLAVVIAGLAHLARLGHAGFVFAREGVFGSSTDAVAAAGARGLTRRAADRAAGQPRSCKSPCHRAHPARPLLCQARPVPGDAAGRGRRGDWRATSKPCRTRCRLSRRPRPSAPSRAALGQPISDLFASFGPAVAAASIAQVHRAEVVTAGGLRAVAVKVLRPQVERRFKIDLDAFTFVARNAERLSAEARRLRLVEVVETLRRSVAIEMDLRFEAAALSEMAENTRERSRFPRPGGGLGPHRARRAHARMDRCDAAL